MTTPVVREPAVDEQGLVHAPTAPGIGYETQWEMPPYGRPPLEHRVAQGQAGLADVEGIDAEAAQVGEEQAR